MRIVLIDIGALRADHLGCYGYAQPTSPAIDRLAQEGLLCTAAFTSDATNAGARAALLSGRFGFETGIVTDGLPGDRLLRHTPLSTCGAGAPRPLLQEYLSAAGVHTAAITPFGRQPAPWFYTGWRETHDPWCDKEPAQVSAAEVNALALAWLTANAGRDFFLYLTYNDLYQPAGTPLSEQAAPYLAQVASGAASGRPDEQAFSDHLSLHAAFSPRLHRAPTRESMAHIAQQYDCRLRAVDDAVGAVMQTLERLGIADETAVAVISDHGVLFGECGCYGGHISAHYHCVRIPLILRAPRLAAAAKVAGLCYGFDLTSTICAIAGLAPPSGYHGRSLLQAPGAGVPGGREYVVCGHGHYTAQRTVISARWKLNRTWHAGFWHFADTALYDIVADPREETDRAGTEAVHVLDLTRKLRQWIGEYGADLPDPLARIACQEPPGFLAFGQELRARVRRGDLRAPEGYKGRWA